MFIICSFLLAQKRTKKGSRSLGLRLPGVYAPLRGAAHKERTVRKVAALRRTVIPLFALLLGCAKWQYCTINL
jgi:hypothetical protein